MNDFPLPQTFEEFSQARQEGFLIAKKIKDEGGHIAGTFCTFTPEEIFDAAGIHTVSLCGTSEETIPAAEAELPSNLCPLIKSSYGFAVSDKCPYTYFSDMIIGETTCDGKKKMYELLGKLKDVYVMQLPQNVDRPGSLPMWKEEIRYLIRYVEEKFGLTITDEELRHACQLRNELRSAKIGMMELQKQVPPPVYGWEVDTVIGSSNYGFDYARSAAAIRQMTGKIQTEYDEGKRTVPEDAKRILITGCPINGVYHKTINILEDNGGVVVCQENCGGIKSTRLLVDTEKDDIVEAIAERYLQIGCAVMSPNKRRLDLIRQLVEEYQVEGIVDVILQACHPYSVERSQIRRLADELGVKYIAVETDYSHTDIGQLSTRLTAFLEII